MGRPTDKETEKIMSGLSFALRVRDFLLQRNEREELLPALMYRAALNGLDEEETPEAQPEEPDLFLRAAEKVFFVYYTVKLAFEAPSVVRENAVDNATKELFESGKIWDFYHLTLFYPSANRYSVIDLIERAALTQSDHEELASYSLKPERIALNEVIAQVGVSLKYLLTAELETYVKEIYAIVLEQIEEIDFEAIYNKQLEIATLCASISAGRDDASKIEPYHEVFLKIQAQLALNPSSSRDASTEAVRIFTDKMFTARAQDAIAMVVSDAIKKQYPSKRLRHCSADQRSYMAATGPVACGKSGVANMIRAQYPEKDFAYISSDEFNQLLLCAEGKQIERVVFWRNMLNRLLSREEADLTADTLKSAATRAEAWYNIKARMKELIEKGSSERWSATDTTSIRRKTPYIPLSQPASEEPAASSQGAGSAGHEVTTEPPGARAQRSYEAVLERAPSLRYPPRGTLQEPKRFMSTLPPKPTLTYSAPSKSQRPSAGNFPSRDHFGYFGSLEVNREEKRMARVIRNLQGRAENLRYYDEPEPSSEKLDHSVDVSDRVDVSNESSFDARADFFYDGSYSFLPSLPRENSPSTARSDWTFNNIYYHATHLPTDPHRQAKYLAPNCIYESMKPVDFVRYTANIDAAEFIAYTNTGNPNGAVKRMKKRGEETGRHVDVSATLKSYQDVYDHFYEAVKEAIEQCPEKNMTFILQDTDALHERIGGEAHRPNEMFSRIMTVSMKEKKITIHNLGRLMSCIDRTYLMNPEVKSEEDIWLANKKTNVDKMMDKLQPFLDHGFQLYHCAHGTKTEKALQSDWEAPERKATPINFIQLRQRTRATIAEITATQRLFRACRDRSGASSVHGVAQRL